jgi:hypothetical protein
MVTSGWMAFIDREPALRLGSSGEAPGSLQVNARIRGGEPDRKE